MTVQELFEVAKRSTIRVKSGYDGRVLCYKFSPDKHFELGSRKIINVYAGLDTNSFTGEVSIHPYICAVVDGSKEYEKTHRK